MVAAAWNQPLPCAGIDALHALDIKLRATAKALKSWSAKRVVCVQVQLPIAKELSCDLTVPKSTEIWRLMNELYAAKQN